MAGHDQNFKNLILDYPRASIEFFAAKEAEGIHENTRILPVRQELPQERLGERFRELDTPLLVEWPDGQREALVFIFEEESKPSHFSVHRLIHYCVDLSELLQTKRIVPVVIFLKRGRKPHSGEFKLSGDYSTALDFRYQVCDLGRLPADEYIASDNIAARLNLPNMRYRPKRRVEIYARAVDGLIELEPRMDYRLKYLDFIEGYANLDEKELKQYEAEYVTASKTRRKTMGFIQHIRDESMLQGMIKNARQNVIEILETRFGKVPKSFLDTLEEIADLARLNRTLKESVKTASLDDFIRWFENNPEKPLLS
ncbi:MAG: hypothetical protein GY862_29710 [Gammaproteobacteria bacterium]|nr:hypothetical protein [Gammaproteobacteria bacterium]